MLPNILATPYLTQQVLKTLHSHLCEGPIAVPIMFESVQPVLNLRCHDMFHTNGSQFLNHHEAGLREAGSCDTLHQRGGDEFLVRMVLRLPSHFATNHGKFQDLQDEQPMRS